ncbi:hypothetical protein KDW_07070 [Dictyobacter vulcani]|uniref:Uncharacterized protein n=1 Tax=Dictyobacter vulcani TaxID=2607529 RepID=A0A5J4KGF2_9CHLR|nr:hypothetical protein KDW_07070 [Dictyobacter vulcani]
MYVTLRLTTGNCFRECPECAQSDACREEARVSERTPQTKGYGFVQYLVYWFSRTNDIVGKPF